MRAVQYPGRGQLAERQRGIWVRRRAQTLVVALAGFLTLGSSATALEVPWPLSFHPRTDRQTKAAQSVAKAVWSKVLVRCGKNRVFALESKDHPPQAFNKYKFEFSSFTKELTPAERLNGTDWKGEFYINSALFRNYRFDSVKEDSPAGHWGYWQDNFTDSAQAGFRLRKFKGQWEITDIMGREGAYQPLDLNALRTWGVSCANPNEPLILSR